MQAMASHFQSVVAARSRQAQDFANEVHGIKRLPIFLKPSTHPQSQLPLLFPVCGAAAEKAEE
jgi:hypothetical protein